MVIGKEKSEDFEGLKKRIIPILKRHHISRAAVFGSLVTGKARRTSDLDILVEFEGRRSLLDLAALKMDLEDETGRKVDVLTYNSLHPSIRENVLKQEVRVL